MVVAITIVHETAVAQQFIILFLSLGCGGDFVAVLKFLFYIPIQL